MILNRLRNPNKLSIKVMNMAMVFSMISPAVGVGRPVWAAETSPSVLTSLASKQIDRIDLKLLEQAKNSSNDLNVLHAILDIGSEWQKVAGHRTRREKVKKLVSEALSAAAEGRFETGKFIIEEMVKSITADDEAAISNGLKIEYERLKTELDAHLARETMRTGKQAGQNYYLEVPVRVVKETKEKVGFWGKKEVVSKTVGDAIPETTESWVPETVIGYPIYGEDNQKVFNKPLKKLTKEDFAKEITAIVKPYSKTTVRGFSFNSFVVDSFCFFMTGRPCDASSALTWTHFRAKNRDAAWEKLKVLYKDVSYRPLSEEDAKVWGAHAFAKLKAIQTILQQMWAQSNQGYRFRVGSTEYNEFQSRLAKYLASIEQVRRNAVIQFLTPDELKSLELGFPVLAGDRPTHLEVAVEVAIRYANSANETEVAKLIKQALHFGTQAPEGLSFEAKQTETLNALPGIQIAHQIRQGSSQAIRDNLVELFMAGKDKVVLEIFNKLSTAVQAKFDKYKGKMDQASSNVMVSLNFPTQIDINPQLDMIKEAKRIIESSVTDAFKPDRVVSKEEMETALIKSKSKTEYKRIYLYKDACEKVQRDLRDAFGRAKTKIGEVLALYNQNTTSEIRQNLIDFTRYYARKMGELNAEFWPYKKMLEPKLLGWKKHDSGVAEPIVSQDFILETMTLFNDEQKREYNLSSVLTLEMVEYAYVNAFFKKMNDAMLGYARSIQDVVDPFREYPSHTLAVALNNNLGTFYLLRKSIGDRINNVVVEEVDMKRITATKTDYSNRIKNLSWLGDAGKDLTEAELKVMIEAARPMYDDLRQN